MKLWGGEDAIVLVLDLCGVQSSFQSRDQVRAGSTSVAGKDDLGGSFMELTNLIDQCLVG